MDSTSTISIRIMMVRKAGGSRFMFVVPKIKPLYSIIHYFTTKVERYCRRTIEPRLTKV